MNFDLTLEQVEATKLAYNTCAQFYSTDIEWSESAIKMSKKFLIKPFIDYIGNVISPIALVGCGTGRDYSLLSNEGYKCDGFDSSSGMLLYAKKHNPYGNFKKLDITKSRLTRDDYSAVFCESALSFIRKKDLEVALKNLHSALLEGGKILIGIKDGGTSLHKDLLIGKVRYYLSYDLQTTVRFIEESGFKIDHILTAPDRLNRFDRYINVFASKIE